MTVTFGAEFTPSNTIVTIIASALITTGVNIVCSVPLNNKNKYVQGIGFVFSVAALAMYYYMLLTQTALKSAED